MFGTKLGYGWVFGIANLAAFLMAPLCGKFGSKIGVKYLYNIGAFLQSSVFEWICRRGCMDLNNFDPYSSFS